MAGEELRVGIRLTADGRDFVGAVREAARELDKLSRAAKSASGVANGFAGANKKVSDTLRVAKDTAIAYVTTQALVSLQTRKLAGTAAVAAQSTSRLGVALRNGSGAAVALRGAIRVATVAVRGFRTALAFLAGPGGLILLGVSAIYDLVTANRSLKSSTSELSSDFSGWGDSIAETTEKLRDMTSAQRAVLRYDLQDQIGKAEGDLRTAEGRLAQVSRTFEYDFYSGKRRDLTPDDEAVARAQRAVEEITATVGQYRAQLDAILAVEADFAESQAVTLALQERARQLDVVNAAFARARGVAAVPLAATTYDDDAVLGRLEEQDDKVKAVRARFADLRIASASEEEKIQREYDKTIEIVEAMQNLYPEAAAAVEAYARTVRDANLSTTEAGRIIERLLTPRERLEKRYDRERVVLEQSSQLDDDEKSGYLGRLFDEYVSDLQELLPPEVTALERVEIAVLDVTEAYGKWVLKGAELLELMPSVSGEVGKTADAVAGQAEQFGRLNRISGILGDVASGFGAMAQHSRTAFRISQAAAVAQAAIATYKNVALVLGDEVIGPFPVRVAFAAVAAAAGAAQIAAIRAQKPPQAYAYGGIVDSPTFFSHRGGLGLAGEAGPEAILPLRRLSSGRLGVEAVGGRGDVIFSPSIHVAVENQAGGDAYGFGSEVGRRIRRELEPLIRDVMVNERRPGGVLNPTDRVHVY